MPKNIPYRIPSMPFIGSTAKKLYAIEDRIAVSVDAMARELVPYIEHVLGRDIDMRDDAELYQTLVPEALASVLNKFDRSSALAACIGYLRREHAAEISQGVHSIDGPDIRITIPKSPSLGVDIGNLPPKGSR